MSTAATHVNERLVKLTEAGVSVWLDQIRRTLITSGELQRLVDEESLRGVTANPSIFEKAILGSDDYDEELGQLARQDLSPQEIYDRIAQHDVQLACDVLAGVYRDTHGQDGFVSLEVAPDIAHDTERTLEMARVYWKAVNRPNLLIKIPGTTEGVPAIEQAIYEGINVNITLLFAVEAYERVADAYLRGLERRQRDDLPLDVHSVASFFVSRVDTNVDKKLEALGRTDLAGTAAVANARQAYRRFKEIFDGPRWEGLRHAGAHVQRPLWASTSAKNPNYSDVKYVEELVGPHTVNTMPLATLMAFADHGNVTGPTAEHDPTEALDALAKAGIDMGQVTEELLVDGVKQFEDAMNSLLAGIEQERAAVITGKPKTIDAALPHDAADAIAKRVNLAMGESIAQRIWRRDP
ncbi:MAG TPA: transaldolase, partial [Solirubrobacteraceae bacterium]